MFGSVLEDRTAFSKRKYCNRECMAAAMEGVIKVPNIRNSRRQSQKKVLPTCEKCGRKKATTRLYVHHKNENPMDNVESNLQTLCGSCHQLTHLRSPKGIPLPPRLCVHCSRPAYRGNLCNTHRSRKWRHGNALLTKKWNGRGEPVYSTASESQRPRR